MALLPAATEAAEEVERTAAAAEELDSFAAEAAVLEILSAGFVGKLAAELDSGVDSL